MAPPPSAGGLTTLQKKQLRLEKVRWTDLGEGLRGGRHAGEGRPRGLEADRPGAGAAH